ncbi:RES family NAD+ phosphorylase [Streptomyces sp. FXJ1.172]|uniref:RES family NAD+ phosphorylase n=1 Tax=Streptomyces sp. FXJ1.172 TaxID=710705 RepID=UPI0007CFDFD7|nr:RES family NAD+ phosphorylase [Streptomyces sp. FXJ1.172]WEO94404.1 RES family NAD+ phosphorylase [Streptomyces sp. FXJ1.172]
MARQIPLEGVPMTPVCHILPAGTVLWRCHEARYAAGEFNPNVAHEFFKGSRFDPTGQDPYPYLYAALDPVTALSEVLLRSVEFGDAGVRLIPWAQASRYVLSALRTTADLSLVDLTTAEALAAVWQDDWLIDTEEYAGTRYWVRVIRERCPKVQGLWWTSKRCRPRRALQLFQDRCPEAPLDPRPQACLRLASADDVRAVNRLLAPLHALVSLPEE